MILLFEVMVHYGLGDVSFLYKLLHLVKAFVCGGVSPTPSPKQSSRETFTTKRIELALDRVQQRARRERSEHERREAADDQLRLELLARVLDGDADLADDRAAIVGLLRDDAVEPARKSNQ